MLRTDRQVQTQVHLKALTVDLAGSDSDGMSVGRLPHERGGEPAARAARSAFVPRQTLLRDLTVPTGVSAALSAASPLIRRLADAEGTDCSTRCRCPATLMTARAVP